MEIVGASLEAGSVESAASLETGASLDSGISDETVSLPSPHAVKANSIARARISAKSFFINKHSFQYLFIIKRYSVRGYNTAFRNKCQ